MKLARYMGGGRVEIVDEPKPKCPAGGLLVRTEACGLCSGELMDWYMDRKIPHVLGHEVAGIVEESHDARFPVGERVFVHHHAPCLKCEWCLSGMHVHCDQWKRTQLVPGGMAEYFAVSAENLNDTLSVGEMRAVDAALIEPLACVVKSMRTAGKSFPTEGVAVIGLGVMGLMHALAMPGSTGFEVNARRADWAENLGIHLGGSNDSMRFDRVFVCPGSQSAFDFALKIANPGALLVMFAPLPPNEHLAVPQDVYFRDIRIAHSYSCGPDDTREAKEIIAAGKIRAEQVVSDFVGIGELPAAYGRMKSGEILKAMVLFQ
jgi:L-iditol 2-dehydrogenase